MNIYVDIETNSLDNNPFFPDNAVITCIAYQIGEEGEVQALTNKENTERSAMIRGEKQIINEFENVLKHGVPSKDITFVGHNMANFDLLWLIYRFRVYRKQFPINFSVFDTMTLSKGGSRKLKHVSKYYDVGGKFTIDEEDKERIKKVLGESVTELSGAHAPILFKAGEFDILEKYCKRDVELLPRIMKKAGKVN